MEEVHTSSPAQLDSEKRFLVQITFGQKLVLDIFIKSNHMQHCLLQELQTSLLILFYFEGEDQALKGPECRGMVHASVCAYLYNLPLHTFRNNNGKYILKWKQQRTYLWPCSDTTLSVSRRWYWFIPVWGQRAEPLSTQSSRDGKKSAWGFSASLLCCFRSLPWITSPSGHGCGSYWGLV